MDQKSQVSRRLQNIFKYLFQVSIMSIIILKLSSLFTLIFIFIIIIIIINLANITTMQPSQSNYSKDSNIDEQKQRKNKYQFDLERGRYLRIQSDFDNGNIGLIRQVTELQYRLQAISDYKTNVSNNQPKKTWFHFKVSAPKGIRVRLIIENVSIYQNMYEDKDWARPVMNDGTGWKEIKDCFLTYRGEVGIIIDYTFSNENFVYFAMAVPHTYQQSQSYLRQLAFRIPEHIQYEDLMIGKSYGGLNLHLLKLTAKQSKNKQGNSSSGNLLTVKSSIGENKNNIRVHSQANIQNAIVSNMASPKKPIIFITSRVHPGQVGSSHCLIGMIDFLTRSCSLQALLILKMFEIMIIPIVNPDGVFEGNYRMDLNNTNLNRVYLEPSPDLHPTVFKIKQIVSSLVSVSPVNAKEKIDKHMSLISRRIMFHFDLHSHSSLKPAFIYGNAFDQIVTQTQSELYCKILHQNSEVFKYDLSQFGEKHMRMKDKGEAMTKQGCARVVISKMANVVYSYTVQTAIFPYLNKQIRQPVSNQEFKLADKFHYENTKIEELISRYNIKNQVFIDNMLLGHSIMISILDLMQKNPYTRIQNLQESLDNYRRQISQNLLQNEERFKLLDIKAYQKVRNIIKCCKEQFTVKNQKQWPHLAVDKLLLNVSWPDCFKMYEPGTLNYVPQQICKKRNRTKTQISESQRQINDFIHPKNMRRRYLNIQTELTKNNETELKKNEVSPSKSLISPRNIQLQMEIVPSSSTNTGSGSMLPQIKMNERNGLQKNRVNSYSLNKYQAAEQIEHRNEETKEKQVKQLKDMKQIKELKQLQQKESTKNIVLSFIHEQIEKINKIRKNAQKSMAVQNRLASYKLIKKNSKSPKGISSMGSVNLPNKYAIMIGSNSISGVPSNNPSIQNSQVLSNSKSNKMLLANLRTCQQIVKQRKNNAIQEDEEQNQYEEEEGIYYVQNTKLEQKEIDEKKYEVDKKSEDHQYHKNRKGNKLPSTSLERVAFPIFMIQKQAPSTIITSKRQLAKVKYSEIKKKNIIRQDLCNNSLKLPQLRGVATINQQMNPGSSQILEKDLLKPIKNNQNGLSINVNLNVNLNVCIGNNQKQLSGRARAATMPDQC